MKQQLLKQRANALAHFQPQQCRVYIAAPHSHHAFAKSHRMQHPRRLALIRAQTEQSNASTSESEGKAQGRTTYRPASYSELITDAVNAICVGLKDGLTRMEVEFPAVSNVDGKPTSPHITLPSQLPLCVFKPASYICQRRF